MRCMNFRHDARIIVLAAGRATRMRTSAIEEQTTPKMHRAPKPMIEWAPMASPCGLTLSKRCERVSPKRPWSSPQ